MAFKIIFVISAIIACVNAMPGGPAAYAISAPSVDHGSVGNSQEHTVKGPYGQTSQSDYASQVQTAHSQSHVQRSSSSHDAGYAPDNLVAHTAYAAPAAYATSGYSYAAPALAYAHPAPAAAISYAAPAYGHAYAAPALSYAAPAPGPFIQAAYSAAPAAYHYPNAALSASYVAPAFKYAAAPAYAAPGYLGHGIGYAAPYVAPAPAYAAHYAAPVVKAAVAAPALVHTSVAAHGVHYGI